MILPKLCPAAVAILAALLFFGGALELRAQEEESREATTEESAEPTGQPEPDSGKEVMRDSKAVFRDSASDVSKGGTAAVGTGNYQRSPFHISVTVREGYDDNVYATSNGEIDSFFTNGAVVLDYRFGSPRTRFDLQAVAGATYYYDRPFGQEYDINTGFTLSLEHHATPRLTFTIASYLTYQSEPDFNNNFFGVNRRVGNFFYTANKFGVGYQWAPRFSTVTSYTLGVINYDDSAIGDFEDRFEHTFGNELRFLVLPTTTLVADYRYQIIDFDVAARDSTTHFVLGGIDHTFNPRFNMSVRAGAEFRDFDNFGERTSPYAESTLRYAAGERTSIAWTSRYGLEEPDVPGTPSRDTFRTGLTISHAVSPRITMTGALFFQHDENDSVTTPTFFVPAFSEDTLDIGLGLRYEINRIFALLLGYSHTEVFSDVGLREYARNRYYLGVNATF